MFRGLGTRTLVSQHDTGSCRNSTSKVLREKAPWPGVLYPARLPVTCEVEVDACCQEYLSFTLRRQLHSGSCHQRGHMDKGGHGASSLREIPGGQLWSPEDSHLQNLCRKWGLAPLGSRSRCSSPLPVTLD